jgi:hypothetical protein
MRVLKVWLSVVLTATSIISCSDSAAPKATDNTVIHWHSADFTVADFRDWLNLLRVDTSGALELSCAAIRPKSINDPKVLTFISQTFALGPEPPVPHATAKPGQTPTTRDVKVVAQVIREECSRLGL